MITNIDQIVSSCRYGMPQEHMEVLLQAAFQTKTVIGIRPVNIFAGYYLKKGNPTKPFCIKNKTCHQGPMAGLIAIDPLYSRETTPSGYEKHEKLLAIAREKDPDKSLVNIPLVLTKERIDELKLLFTNSATTIKYPNETEPDYEFNWKKGERIFYAKGIKNKSGTYSIVDRNNFCIEVLGRKIENLSTDQIDMLPITADYDLFAVCPRKEELDPGFFDKNPFRTQGLFKNSLQILHEQIKESEENAKLPLEKRNPKLPEENPHAGNWSPRVEKVTGVINHIMHEKDPNRKLSPRPLDSHTVHHNEELKNPFADDLQANLPCLFVFPISLYLPKKKEGQVKTNIVLIESVDEMIKLRNFLQSVGYYWPSHARYQSQFKPFSSNIIKIINNLVEQMKFHSKIDKTVSDWEMANSDFGKGAFTSLSSKRRFD